MQQTTSSTNTMFGFNMSQECAEQWARSHDFYKTKPLDPKNLRKIALFILDGLNSSSIETKKRNIENAVYALAAEMDVRLSKISFFSDPNSIVAGGYIKDNHSMVLNLAQLNDEASFLVTIIHELRHAQQHEFMYSPDNELASRIKFAMDHYTRPTGQIIKNAQYFSNLVEVDAELTSYFFTKNILGQLQSTPEFMAHPGFVQKLESTKHLYASGERAFYQELDSALAIVDLSENARDAIHKLAISYSKELFSPENRDHSKTTPEMSNAIIEQLDKLISSTGGKQIIDFSAGDFYLLKSRIFGNVSTIDVLSHLDDPFMEYIKSLEDRYEVVAASQYEKYVTELRTKIAEPLERFLKKYDLPYTKGDYPSMLNTYFEAYPEITIQNLLSGKEEPSGNIHIYFDFICKDLKPKKQELTDPDYYLKRVPLEILQERAEEAVRNKTYSAATWILPEFTEVCKEHVEKNMFGKYFAALKVPNKEWEEYSMGQAYDILKKTAPKFIIEHILDENISEFNEQIIDFCLRFGDVSLERLNKELSSHPILKLKLRILSKGKYDDLPAMIKKLQWQGRPLKYILDPNKKKRDEQTLS